MKFIDLADVEDTMEEFSNMLDNTWSKAEIGPEAEDEELDTLPDAPESSKFVFKAMCTSEQCSPTFIGVQKVVATSADVCPDCAHYLFWSRELA